MAERRFRRPAMLDPAEAELIEGDEDPATRSEVAHTTAGPTPPPMLLGEQRRAHSCAPAGPDVIRLQPSRMRVGRFH